jgi:hypothetical protein
LTAGGKLKASSLALVAFLAALSVSFLSTSAS